MLSLNHHAVPPNPRRLLLHPLPPWFRLPAAPAVSIHCHRRRVIIIVAASSRPTPKKTQINNKQTNLLFFFDSNTFFSIVYVRYVLCAFGLFWLVLKQVVRA
jgi:hypothetical protein